MTRQVQNKFTHQTTSTSNATTTRLLYEDFSRFGYNSIVTDNATTFSSAEFKDYCSIEEIAHQHWCKLYNADGVEPFYIYIYNIIHLFER